MNSEKFSKIHSSQIESDTYSSGQASNRIVNIFLNVIFRTVGTNARVKELIRARYMKIRRCGASTRLILCLQEASDYNP